MEEKTVERVRIPGYGTNPEVELRENVDSIGTHAPNGSESPGEMSLRDALTET
jgi:hypothetical protein